MFYRVDHCAKSEEKLLHILSYEASYEILMLMLQCIIESNSYQTSSVVQVFNSLMTCLISLQIQTDNMGSAWLICVSVHERLFFPLKLTFPNT